MKVVMLTREYPPHIYGGAGVVVDQLTRALARRMSVEVRCFGAREPSADGVTVRGYTPWERLKEFPRYLQAIEQRLEKLPLNPRRDAQLNAEIAPLEARYRERVKAERGLRPPGDDEFRWLLEEFRVSLFAQQLKTRVPVSARRLEDAWAERERALPG